VQQIVSATVVDQVDDLQETVEDLVEALEDADGLSINNQHLQDARKRLDKMEQELDRNADLDDARWNVYATGDQFTPGIQKNVSELAQILRSLLQQGA
jgi:biopolymer transport protein ExbB/TolQ